MVDFKYIIGGKGVQKKENTQKTPIYVNHDAQVASKLIDALFGYINEKIPAIDTKVVHLIWAPMYRNANVIKEWLNDNDVNRLLDQFEQILKERKKQ